MSAPSQLSGNSAKARFEPRSRIARFLVFCALAYPIVLLVLFLGLYCVGEGWWVTAAGLYVPRIPFTLPLPFAVVVLSTTGFRRLLWTQAGAFVVLVPLMGFVAPWPTPTRTAAPTLRVLSFNVNSGFGGVQAIAETVLAGSADVVLLQEAPWSAELADALHRHYPHVERSTQFIVASRYPIVSSTDPERLSFFGRQRSPRFMRYLIDTPLGQIAVYSVHPISPRGVLHLHQFRGVLHELRTGELFAGDPESDIRTNTGLRALQIATAAEEAAQELHPTLIAGDTNLPGLSAVFRRNLSRYADGFRVASSGLGYTFPSSHPFLRLDRILTNDKLAIVSFQVGCRGVSDHLCVMADIQAQK